MAYFVLSPSGEESLKTFLSPDPDPDHLRGGPSHGYYNAFCLKQSQSIGAIVFELCVQTDSQTGPNALPSDSSPGAIVKM